jgi:glycosyltransferase involved in cell wall biosynthesis
MGSCCAASALSSVILNAAATEGETGAVVAASEAPRDAMRQVSVIIPVLNGELFIAAALQSILGQSQPPAEIIVADGGSSDRTPAIVAAFPLPVRLMSLPKLGVADSLNAAIAASIHPLLAFLDADDFWAPDKTAWQIAALEADPTIEAVFGDVEEFTDKECRVTTPEQISGQRRKLSGVSKITMLIRRTAFDRIGRFDGTSGLADFPDWYARAIKSGFRTEAIDRVVAYRRVHDNNMSRLRREELRRDYLRIARAAIRNREPQ